MRKIWFRGSQVEILIPESKGVLLTKLWDLAQDKGICPELANRRVIKSVVTYWMLEAMRQEQGTHVIASADCSDDTASQKEIPGVNILQMVDLHFYHLSTSRYERRSGLITLSWAQSFISCCRKLSLPCCSWQELWLPNASIEVNGTTPKLNVKHLKGSCCMIF